MDASMQRRDIDLTYDASREGTMPHVGRCSKARGLILSAWLVALLAGCGPFLDTPMHAATADVRAAPANQAMMIFVRPMRGSDRYWNLHSVVATEDGHYVAALGRNERISVAVAPGKHVYFVFREGANLGSDQQQRVDAIVVDASPGKVYYAAVNLTDRGQSGPAPMSKEEYAQTSGTLGAPIANEAAAMRLSGPAAFTDVAPIALRFGQSAADVATIVKETQPVEADPALAQRYEQEHGRDRFWSVSVDGGRKKLAAYDAATLDRMTLHADDGF
jgi:hypothetical protein